MQNHRYSSTLSDHQRFIRPSYAQTIPSYSCLSKGFLSTQLLQLCNVVFHFILCLMLLILNGLVIILTTAEYQAEVFRKLSTVSHCW